MEVKKKVNDKKIEIHYICDGCGKEIDRAHMRNCKENRDFKQINVYDNFGNVHHFCRDCSSVFFEIFKLGIDRQILCEKTLDKEMVENFKNSVNNSIFGVLKEDKYQFGIDLSNSEWNNQIVGIDISQVGDFTIKHMNKPVSKDTPEKVIQSKDPRWGMGYDYYDYLCPGCGKFIAYEPQGMRFIEDGDGPKRCKHCGKALLWE